MDAQELQKLNIAGIYHASTGQTLREQDVPEVTKFAEAVIKAWAERAVSPAESVQSVEDFLPRDLAPTDAEQRLLEHAADERQKGYAEGRRSALEELHPQWLKEKGRADRAEAVAAACNIVKYDWKRRAKRAEEAQAARQAPDWSKLTMLTPACPHGVATMMPQRMGSYVLLSEVKALLSSTAQPLQQEGGKEALIQAVDAVLRDALDAVTVHPCDVNDDKVRAQQLIGPMADLYKVRHSQPSDNLQQASTAQAEPGIVHLRDFMTAEQIADSLSPSPVMNCTEALQAAVDSCSEQATREGGTDEIKKAWLDALASGTGVLVGGKLVSYHDMLKPATPEGEELPEAARQNGGVVRAALIDIMAAVEPSALSGARDFEQQSEFRVLFARARAALAATTAAEPVAWAQALKFGAQVIELYDDATMRHGDYMLSSTECAGVLEALASYRAAPPQQVDTGGLPG
jgi:hypothetical protein